jgi:hypothetical protein
MWIEDLSPYGESDRCVAVGWLERGHDHIAGKVPPEVFAKLESLLVDPWQAATAAGFHACDLCVYSPERRGANNLFVPGASRVYVAPELILHYMNAHGCRPPGEFCQAVLVCPPMRSTEDGRFWRPEGPASSARLARLLLPNPPLQADVVLAYARIHAAERQ